jgi:putative ABC transport system permease protein
VSQIQQTLSSIRHRPTRFLLTALGTALGIATIVALLAVSSGAERTAGELIDLGPGDFGLFQKSAADPTTSVLPLPLVRRIERLPQIRRASPMQLLVSDLPQAPGAILFGIEPHSFLAARTVIERGRMFDGPQQIVVGSTLASQLHVRLGQALKVGHRHLTVTGISHVGIAFQDDGAFLPLSTAQQIAGDPDEATTIVAEAKDTVPIRAAERAVTRRFPDLQVILDGQEAVRAGANGQLISNATLVVAALALIVGGIGVMNTMLMSVIERRAEFALLSAVGWSGPQIAGLVFVEGMVVSILGAAIGLLIGTIGAGLLVHALGASALVSPDVTAWDLGRGLLVGVLIGLLGGLYPAWRAAHVSPARVLASH